MRFLRQSLMGLFLAALALGMLAYAGDMVRGAILASLEDDRPGPPKRERVFAVGVVTATLGREVPVLQAFGEIRAERTLELRAAAAGRIVELSQNFVEGGAVRAGDLLLRIDPADAQSARDRAEADLADAQAEILDAEAGLLLARDELSAAVDQQGLQARAFDRQQDLAQRGVGTSAAVEVAELSVAAARQAMLSRRQGVTQAEARISQSKTRLRRMEIALAEATRRLAETEVYAPFDGTLSEVTLTTGRLLSNNEKLATLIDPQALEVAFRLSTAQYVRLLDDGRLTERPVEVKLDVSGIDLTARGLIRREQAAVGEAQSGRLIFASLTETSGFKPGDFVTVQAEEPAINNVLRLPAGALDGSGTVLVLEGEDRLDTLPVTLLRRQGNEVLIRGEGLAGREIVTARSPLLGAGIAVRPLRKSEQTAEIAPPAMVELSEERRAKLVAFVESGPMPEAVKERLLTRLSKPEVPAQMIERIESRMGG
ncbi:MAG: HlyD family efflux transporter periplasmic adaptor subunit [Aliishimia sp.]